MNKETFDDKGWRIFEITTPSGVSFKLGFKDNTLRIRRQGWVPIEKDSIRNSCTEVHIRTDVYHKEDCADKGKATPDLAHYSVEEGFGE